MTQPQHPAESSPIQEVSRSKSFFSGLAMGTCNVIPGGDSGTIALIVGIYDRIINAISSVDAGLLKDVLQGQFRAVARRLDLGFMLPLLIGVAVGILTVGSLMDYLVEHHFEIMTPLFFGMIAASCYLVAKLINRWGTAEIALLVGGGIFAFWLISQPALANPPKDHWYFFLCGLIGICALILPGISGAFILLIMGTYHQLTGVIRRTVEFSLTPDDFGILIAFCLGCAFGLVGCSKILKWLLKRFESPTLALLCGIKIGSLWKIFPFQTDTTPEIAEFDDKIFQPVPLNQIPLDGQFWITIGIVLVSAVAVLLLEHLALTRSRQLAAEEKVPATN